MDILEMVRKMYEDEYLSFKEIATALCLSEDYIRKLYKLSNRE